MKNTKEILKWLQANLGPHSTAGLTSHDTNALMASVAIAPLVSYRSAPSGLFYAFRNVVGEMQAPLRHLAFHAIAAELDWGHRQMIWEQSSLESVTSCEKFSVCFFEPGGGGQAAYDLKFPKRGAKK